MTHELDQEQWRWVEGSEGRYEVSNLGKVRSYYRGADPKLLRLQRHSKTGYIYVALGSRNIRAVHRLVAGAFILNEDALPEVNHLDGDRANNTSDNLEWVTSSANKKHSYACLKRKKHAWTQAVTIYDGTEELSFISELAAARHLNVAAASVRSARNRGHRCQGWNVRLTHV